MFGSCVFRGSFLHGRATVDFKVLDLNLTAHRSTNPTAASLEDRDTGIKKSVDESSVV